MPEVCCLSGISFNLRAALLSAAYLWSDCQRCIVPWSCSSFPRPHISIISPAPFPRLYRRLSHTFTVSFSRLYCGCFTLCLRERCTHHWPFAHVHSCALSFDASSSTISQAWSIIIIIIFFFFKASISIPHFHCLTLHSPGFYLAKFKVLSLAGLLVLMVRSGRII